MLVVRSLRPDRMTNSLNSFIRGVLPNGNAYADCDSTLSAIEVLDQSLGDSTPSTPIYFILSPGANVVGILDKLADKYKYVEWTRHRGIGCKNSNALGGYRQPYKVHT
jgi:dynein heavy chain